MQTQCLTAVLVEDSLAFVEQKASAWELQKICLLDLLLLMFHPAQLDSTLLSTSYYIYICFIIDVTKLNRHTVN